MIVALLNQQDGVGKTTLALHLGGVWACQGQRVAVIDADPDACAVEWSELRAQETLPSRFTVIAIARDTLHRELPTITRDVDRAIIDGPSHIEPITRSALMAADFVLVPVHPPPFQGLAFVETLRLANGMMTVQTAGSCSSCRIAAPPSRRSPRSPPKSKGSRHDKLRSRAYQRSDAGRTSVAQEAHRELDSLRPYRRREDHQQ
jgi:hypothetical protein